MGPTIFSPFVFILNVSPLYTKCDLMELLWIEWMNPI